MNKTPRRSFKRGRLESAALLLFLVVASLLFCSMVSKDRFGAYYDDGLYVVAAKALATGQGYRTISLPEEKVQTLIPPMYPFLLSLIWRVDPRFPENITWMMLFSVIGMLSFLWLLPPYLVRNGYASQTVAIAVAALAAINWRTMLLAATLMSDITYSVFAIAALHLAERLLRSKGGKLVGLATGVAMGLAFLIRTAGITLLVAFVVYCIIRRQWKILLLPLATASIFILSWLAWVSVHRSIGTGENAVYYSNYLVASNAAFSNLEAINHAPLVPTVLGVAGTNILLLVVGSIPLSCLGLRYDLAPPGILVCFVLLTLALISMGAIRHVRKGFRLLHSYLATYLLLHLFTPGTGYDRYVLPIAPFLLLFWLTELKVPLELVRTELISKKETLGKLTAGFVGLLLLVYVAGVFYSNGSGIYRSVASAHKDESIITENSAAIEWIKANTAMSDVVACYRDPLMYLYTERKAVLSFPMVLLNTIPYHSRELTFDEQANAFLKIVAGNKAQYLLLNSEDFRYESELYRNAIEKLIQHNPARFIPVFRSAQSNSVVYRIQVGANDSS